MQFRLHFKLEKLKFSSIICHLPSQEKLHRNLLFCRDALKINHHFLSGAFLVDVVTLGLAAFGSKNLLRFRHLQINRTSKLQEFHVLGPP